MKEFRLVEFPDDYPVIEQLQPNAQRNQLEEAERTVPKIFNLQSSIFNSGLSG
jgi:hypothetical protein